VSLSEDGQIVLQPNGLFARWTYILNNFTHTNMNSKEAIDVAIEYDMTSKEAAALIFQLEQNPKRHLDFYCHIQDLVERNDGETGEAEKKKELMSKHHKMCKMGKH